ncbi:MAG: helix-turn-helix domain-containing protein, partial [Gammaproteobacteria bacterium]|nr:helix-turn-helix domain-containing protein [Gammaproteobacteria bacterium]
RRRHAVELYRSRQRTVKEICALVGISRSTLYAYVEEFAETGGTVAPEPGPR